MNGSQRAVGKGIAVNPTRRRNVMEPAVKEKEETTTPEEKRGGRKWGSLIFKFLMYGGWLAVLVVFLAVYILISILSK
jgi:hypothetical protein